ncbi:TetR/AcrR family transcriptional regulator [Desemzia incerta]|uniref:TetR/AcrR family transcriptional regulator n=1 Tax=Desemzia incerta TaxID=82801 RepID=UPI0024C32022|nr:TetR/AcrR family transcriptional regulator [Desemzia incerta]WHZ31072.1 TetR/AcrR family transcriptional regulator [Desemzia incerta]
MVREKKFTQDELYRATHKLILEVGYDNFSFMLLSKRLQISRAALYKYYTNKDDLILDYLTDQMEQLVLQLKSIEWSSDFKEKLSQLIALIFEYADTHAISYMIPSQKWNNENANLSHVQKSKEFHTTFYSFIQQTIEEGQEKGYLLETVPSMLIIELIFHSITLPNRTGLNTVERTNHITEILLHGILKNPE